MTESSERRKARDLIKQRRGSIPESLRDSYREAGRIKRAIRKALAEEPKTVPEISSETDISPEKVFWFLNSMRKYGEVQETTTRKGPYYTYTLLQKEEQ